ncbi:MAG: DUF2339 domain-containing protein, partial [Psychrobacter sp.]|nr:DUF2339 domain-containing protein [Psychrobacter sp.]
TLFNDKVQISLIIMWTLIAFLMQHKLADLLANFAWLKGFNWQKILIRFSYLLIPLAFSWIIISNWYHSGVVWDLPYIPVLNLYDIAVILAMGYGLTIYYALQNSTAVRNPLNPAQPIADNINKRISILLKAIGIISFWVLSSMLVRTLHAYASTPLWIDGAWNDDKVQTSLTILWTLTALVATFMSSRNGKRFWWFMGIGLLGVVVLKLVLVDLSQTGAILRVISFLVAGSLILLIGYLAPLPPEHKKESEIVEDIEKP